MLQSHFNKVWSKVCTPRNSKFTDYVCTEEGVKPDFASESFITDQATNL